MLHSNHGINEQRLASLSAAVCELPLSAGLRHPSCVTSERAVDSGCPSQFRSSGGGVEVEGINLSASILTSLQGFFFFSFFPFFQLNGHHPRSNPRGARGVDFLSVCLE